MEEKSAPYPSPEAAPQVAAQPEPVQQPPTLPCEEAEECLEFRPAVKYAGIAALVLMLLGVEYATYRGGYAQGFHEASESGQVQISLNEAAVANLKHFMQAASADDETLLASIANRAQSLAWIREPAVRREAEWMLAQSALDRGLAHRATEMLGGLLREAPANEVWAARAFATARALTAEKHPQEALAYYRFASSRFASLGKVANQLTAMNEMAVLLAADTAGSEEAVSALEALLEEAAAIGEPGRLLRADILAFMGRLYRDRGEMETALRYFEQALSGVDANEVPALASAAVCYGSALLEKGETERAETLLREGVSRLGDSPADASYLVVALRDLARLEQERGASDAALALLYRAEGAATNRIAPQNSFWASLYDQRGWVNMLKGSHEAALADFCRAIDAATSDELRLLSFEGAGECCVTLGHAEQAVQYLTEAVALRTRAAGHDAVSLGRVQLRLGQAQDMLGNVEAAAAAYAESARLLEGIEDEEVAENRIAALMYHGYALGQLRQWSEAANVWDSLLPLVEGNASRVDEVRNQLALCRRYGASPTGSVDPDDGGEEETAQAEPRPEPRRSNRRSRRR